MTAAQYTFPSAVGCSVMSVSQSRSSSATVNWRCTRSSSVAALTRFFLPLRRWMPCRPAWRMRRATRLRFTVSPRPSTSSAWTRGHP